MKIREKNGTGVLDLTLTGPSGGIAAHVDGDHICMGEFAVAKPGQNLAGLQVVAISQDGTYETLDTGAGKLRAHHGPAQIATNAYRESWERTFGPKDSFGARGGVS